MVDAEQELKTSIPRLWIKGEWCTYLGKVFYHEFERGCGEKYFLNNPELAQHLKNLIYQT